MTTEAIIQRILGDAEAEAAAIVAGAREKADSIRARAGEEASVLTERERTRTERDARDIVERRRMVAALDVKKADLAARRGCLDEAFETALAKMCAMPETEYEDYVTRLLNRYAEYGDTVVLARDARVDNSYIMALPVYEGKKLRLSRERGDFAGGFVLVGEKYDKRLTFEDILASMRTELEPSVADALFTE